MNSIDIGCAVITGGGGGIGPMIGRALGRQGFAILLADIDGSAAEQAATRLSADGCAATSIRLDVTDPDQCYAMAATAHDRYGSVAVLVNNAAVMGAPGWQSAPESRPIDWDVSMAVNVKGLFLCSMAVAPGMIAAEQGKIINIASIAGRIASPNYPHYHASKAAVINYTQSLALRLAPHKINVNAVSPAMVWTAMTDETFEWQRQFGSAREESARATFLANVERRAAFKRETLPEDVADAVAFLASGAARNITGQTLNVDGGAVFT